MQIVAKRQDANRGKLKFGSLKEVAKKKTTLANEEKKIDHL